MASQHTHEARARDLSPAAALTSVPGPSLPSSDYADQYFRPRRSPENIDKVSKTRENRRSRGKCEDQDLLTSILNG